MKCAQCAMFLLLTLKNILCIIREKAGPSRGRKFPSPFHLKPMQTKHYQTEDFYLAAFLVASAEQLITHSRQNGITSFCFSQTEKLNELISKYYQLKASINPVTYGTAIRNLKTVIHTDNVLSNQTRNHVEQYQRNS